MPEVSCTAVAVQSSSEWPCSLCPFPQLRLVGVRTSYIHFSNISWTPRVLDPITNPFLGSSSWLHPASTGLAMQEGKLQKSSRGRGGPQRCPSLCVKAGSHQPPLLSPVKLRGRRKHREDRGVLPWGEASSVSLGLGHHHQCRVLTDS